MNHFLIRSALAAAALIYGTAASAVTLDFESFDTTIAPSAPLLRDGDYLIQDGYFINTQALVAGSSSIVAELSTSAASGSCLGSACPTGDGTRFLTVSDEGILHVGKMDDSSVSFDSIIAAAIPSTETPTGSTVYLVIEADRDDGSYGSFAYALSGTGNFERITSATTSTWLAGTGTLTSGSVTDLYFYSYACDAGRCEFLDSGLALDDIRLDEAPAPSAVPEASSWLLMPAGIGVISLIGRRRCRA